MRPKYRIAAFFLICAFPWIGVSAAESPLHVIGFSESLILEVDGKPVDLTSGSLGYALRSGARATLVAGEAMLLIDGTLVKADGGDSFTFFSSDGKSQILVHAGIVEITAPGRGPVNVRSGRFVPITGPEAGQMAEPEPPPPPVAPPAVDARPPARPQGFDPLSGMERVFGKLSRMERPQVKLILELHPYYRLSETYDTNIYLVPPDKPDGTVTGGGVLGSWVTSHNLGSRFVLPINRRNNLAVGYDAQAVTYSQQPGANNAANQVVSVNYDYTGRALKASAYESYLNTEDPAFSELVKRERRFQNSVGVRADYAASRVLFLGLTGGLVNHKYLNPSLSAVLNRYELSSGGEIGMRIAPKTKTFLSYRREVVHYSAGRATNSKSHRAGLGVTGQLASKLQGSISADWQFRRYDIPANPGGKNQTTFLTAVNLSWTATRRTSLTASVFRSISETTFGANRFYIANGCGLGLAHDFHKLRFAVNGTLESDRYPDSTTVVNIKANRRDDLYSGEVRLDYRIRPWMETGLSFKKMSRFSTFSGSFNYEAERTGAHFDITF